MKTKLTNKYYALVLAVTGLMVSVNALGNESLFAQADKAAQEQRLADMQRIYELILRTEPNDVRALTGKATAQAWQGDYSAAQETYSQALSHEPKNLDALVGLGYAYAWSGQYNQAHTAFQQALSVDRTHSGARKGIAYAYHWAGEHELALEFFELAQSVDAADPEIAEASGHVNLSLGHRRDAIRDFDAALALDPQRDSARQARRSAFTTAPAFEISTRVGSTSGAGSGLRAIEVAHWASLKTRLAARYDNSLGLDNSSIADRGDDAPGYFLSAQQAIGDRWLANLELGRRDLTGGNQDIVALQGAYNAGLGIIKLGGQIGRHDAGHTDSLIFGAINLPVAGAWRIEPTLYVSESGAAGDNEWRAVVNTEYHPSPSWSVGAFLGTGQISAVNPAFDGGTTLAGVWGNLLVADRHSVHLLLRREDTPADNFTVAELGFVYRLPGN